MDFLDKITKVANATACPSLLIKVTMNELVLLPLEVLGANYLDPHPRSVLRVLCALLSQITHTLSHVYLNYEDPLKMIIVS